MNYIYFNGKIVPKAKGVIAIDDIGILRGYAVFDFLKVIDGKALFLKEHISRLFRSGKVIGLVIPQSQKDISKAVIALLEKNKAKNCGVRIVITGGKANGLKPTQPLVYILLEPYVELPIKAFTNGIKLMSYGLERNPSAAKTTNYIHAVKLQKEKERNKATEILYVKGGKVTECSTSNFFIVKDGKIITADKDILIGITRNAVLTLARKEFGSHKIIERSINEAELKTADEAFITATNKDVTPVVQIDQIKIGNGKVGEITKKIMSLYIDSIKVTK